MGSWLEATEAVVKGILPEEPELHKLAKMIQMIACEFQSVGLWYGRSFRFCERKEPHRTKIFLD